MASVINAPNMFQNMVAPDLAAQQVQLQRQQQIADMLRQQGSSPIEQQTVTGAGPARVVPISGLQSLAKILQSGAGSFMQNSLDKKNAALNQDMGKRYAAILNATPDASPAASATQAPDVTTAATPPQVTPDPTSPPMAPPPVAPTDNQVPPSPATQASVIPEAQTQPQDNAPTTPAMIAAVRGSPEIQSPSLSQPTTSSPSTQNNRFAMANLVRGNLISQMGGDAAGQEFWKSSAPTDFTRLLSQSGIDPNSLIGKQLLQAQVAKQNHIAPTSLRPGGYVENPDGTRQQLPQVPEGFQAVDNGNGGWNIVKVTGGTEAIAQAEEAKLKGKNAQTLTPTEQLPVDSQGRPIPQSIATTLGNNAPQQSTPTSASGLDLSQLNPQQQAVLAKTDPQAFANGVADFQKTGMQPPQQTQPQGAGLPVGTKEKTVTDITNAANALDKKWTSQQSDSKDAETNNSYLRQITSLAQKADTGRFEDQMNLWNSVLAPYSEKASTAAEAHSLIDKYQSQIIQRLGGNTDALRSIQGAGTPGNEMFKGAIPEAAGNLIGQNDMRIARTNFLKDQGNNRDAVGYTNKEVTFDQNANPMIWQYKNLQPGSPQAKEFIQKAVKSDPNFIKKMQQLEKIGAL